MSKTKRPVHIEVTPKKGESPERMIKRFMKKYRNSDLLEMIKEHMVYTSPSEKRKEKKRRREYVLNKIKEQDNNKRKK